jgi:hypothetical protein
MRFAKLASNFHSNPKIMRASRDGRDAFLFVLCKHSELECDGVVPGHYLEPDYVSLFTKQTPSEVQRGMAECCSLRLLERLDTGDVRLCGWDDDWRPPDSDAERARRYRAKQRDAKQTHHVTVTQRHVTSRDVRDASHLEEIEERRERSSKTGKLPFTVRELIEAFQRGAGDKFDSKTWDDGLAKPLTGLIRQLGEKHLELADVEAGGRHVRGWQLTEPLGVAWLAKTGKLLDAISKARTLNGSGRLGKGAAGVALDALTAKEVP